LFGNMDDGIVEEGDASAAIASGRAVAFVQEYMVHVIENIVDDGPVGVLADKINAPGNRAGRIQGIVRAGRIAMDMHEDVPFDPGVGAVQIETIIRSAIKDIVDNLENSTR